MRGLIIFDALALMNTCVPYVIHDGEITNSFVNNNLLKIMNYYKDTGNSIGDKQIFVCMEKLDTYSGELLSLVNETKVILLGDKEESLYGKKWNIKEKK